MKIQFQLEVVNKEKKVKNHWCRRKSQHN